MPIDNKSQNQPFEFNLHLSPIFDLSSMAFIYRSQTSNGISQSESGQLQQARSAEESPAYVVQGEYSYIGADGQTYTVRYTADASGFHPEGAHLPKAL